MEIKKNIKNIPKFYCEFCDFKCCIKSDMDRHILRPKHINNANGNKMEIKNIKKHNDIHICLCGKEYNTISGLWKHKKKCNKANETETEQLENTFISSTVITPAFFMEVLHSNKEIQNVLIEQNKELQNKLLEQNAEHHKQIIELANKQVINTTNNTTNNNTTNNTQFNLQIFLNETCKDAMNIADFVNSLQVQIADLEKTGKLGYVEGISGIFLRGLKELDYTMRPIHCTDLKRETVYVKDENSWEKDDDEKAKLKLAIQKVARKNLRTLPKWQEENPDFRILDTKENDDYLKIALNSMGGQTDEEHDKYVDKIMRNVLKEVVIEKK